MLKYFTLIILAFGLVFFLSCDTEEESPMMQEELAYTKWKVAGFVPAGGTDLRSSPVGYILEFVNDSTFILRLDANRMVGKYQHSMNGELRILEAKQTNDCCDSQFALEMAAIFRNTAEYSPYEGGVRIAGSGEIFLLKQ